MPLTNPEASSAPQIEQFNIQIASKMTGLNPHTIRAWEKRYQAVTPERDSKGRRVYNQEELARLALLNQLVFHGHNISTIATLSDEQLNELFETLFQTRFNFEEFQNISTSEPFNTQECLQNLTLALVTQSLNIVNHELDKARIDLNGYSFVQNIIKPFMTQVQKHFEGQQIDKFQYEVIQNLVQSQLATKAAQQQTVSDQKVSALLYFAPGMLNVIEALKTALTLDSEKVTYHFLASELSPEAAGILSQQFECQHFIYVGHPEEFENSHLKAYEFIRNLKPHLPTDCEIITVGTERLLFNDVVTVLKQKDLKHHMSLYHQNQQDLSA